MIRKPFRVLLLLAALCLFARPGRADLRAREKVLLGPFGTVSRLSVWDDFDDPAANLRFEALWAEVSALLRELDGLLSLSVPDSEIARFNALPEGGRMPVSPRTADVLRRARTLHALTDGYFDPSVYPLVDLWGFSPRFRNGGGEAMPYDRPADAPGPPEERWREALLPLVGFSGIRLAEDASGQALLVKETASVTVDGRVFAAEIDLGGIAKGYAADLVTAMMREAGVTRGFFSCGTSSVSLLRNPRAEDGAFSLAVRNPRPAEGTPEAFATVRVADACLSTSGDYEDNYFVAGQRACHIVDPFTGYPLNVRPGGVQEGLCAATLLSGSACDDDALTTALLLMGETRALSLLDRLGDREWLLVRYRADSDEYAVLTNVPEERIEVLDGRFRIANP